MKQVAIIGGGISGLTTAYRLSQSDLAREGKLKIHVFESANRFGGVIQTESRNGFLMENGPDSFITTKPWALDLCKELGLAEDLIETNPEARQSYILFKGRLVAVPRGFYLMAPTHLGEAMRTPLLSLRGKVRMAAELFIPRNKIVADESLGSFVRRRFGQELLERIAQPMIAGIYTADPEELSLEATFPHFLEMERKHGSVIRALAFQKNAATQSASGPRYSLFLSLKGGMSSLISRLKECMPDVCFYPESEVVKIDKSKNFKIHFQNKEPFQADILCLALPAPKAATLLCDISKEIAEKLKEIRCETAATVNLAFNRKDIRHPLNGAGYVVPSIEKKEIVGCTFSSVKFAKRHSDDKTVLLRVYLGGKASRDLIEAKDESLIRRVCSSISNQIGLTADAVESKISRLPEAIPQYRVGHRQIVENIFLRLKDYPDLYLTGSAYEGMGVPDCIQHASKTAQKILLTLENSGARTHVI